MNTTYDSSMNTRKRNQHCDDLKDSATAITHWCKCQRYCVRDQGGVGQRTITHLDGFR